MGLWIKNADGTIEKAAGGGGGGTFDGDHVLTGDPLNPPAELGAGQLLWDGVEGGGSGDGGGPHHHDYLPLAGGTITGDLKVTGDTMTGLLTATGNIATTGVDVTSNYPQLLLYEADGTVNSRKLSLGITNSTAYLRVFNDAGSVVREFIRFGMESATMDMSVSTSVVVPAPTSARQALRWGSDAEVAALTANGNVTVTKDTPEVAVDTPTAATSSVVSFKVAGVRRFAFVRNHIGEEADKLTLNKYSAGGAFESQPWKVTRDGAVEMDRAASVLVPAPTAANQAAQTTAIDATTGRMAINGIEMGDTGWRSVTQENGWAFTEFKIRRIGNQVFCEGVWPINADDNKTSATVFTLPWGWQPGQLIDHPVRQPGAPPDIFLRSNVGNIQAYNTATSTTIYFSVSWLTEHAWPSSLPGTATRSAEIEELKKGA